MKTKRNPKLGSTEDLPEYQENEKGISDLLTPGDGLPSIHSTTGPKPKQGLGLKRGQVSGYQAESIEAPHNDDDQFGSKVPKKCSRCGAKYKEDPSCGKSVHEFLPPKPQKPPKMKTKKSPTLNQKLAEALVVCGQVTFTENTSRTIDEMVRMASSPRRFDSRQQFARYLTEGTLLNVNRLVSLSINIPCGEYVVYRMTPQKSVLVPTSEITVEHTDFTRAPKAYEVFNTQLLGCWNKIDKTLTEDEFEGNEDGPEIVNRQGELESPEGRVHNVDQNIAGAIRSSGKTQKEIADECGVGEPTVSRWKNQGATDGARLPSLKHAKDLLSAVGGDISLLDKKIDKADPEERRATGGSGGGRHSIRRRGNR